MDNTTITKSKGVHYCLYVRKSTEKDELQALSIASQTKEMMQLAEKEKLKVVDVRQESHSAKDSGSRPIFNKMIQDIKAEKIQGILTWAPDRLSRNAGDLGRLVDLMDQKYLIEIRTFGQKFTDSPNDKFLLMILGSQAKLENDNKGLNVKRGLRAKCEMGFRPGMTPLGYLNKEGGNKGEKKIILDPVRAPLIREMFERVGYDDWTGRDVLDWLKENGFKTRSGKDIVLSTVYDLLKNTYYYGEFEYPKDSGTWYKVNHKSIITKDLFREVQRQLAVAPRTRAGMKEFEFTNLMKCGNCGSGISAEDKFKKLKDGSTKRYVYYHCTKGADRDCKEPYISEEDLVRQFTKLIDRIPINQLKAQRQLNEELERFNKFNQKVLKNGQQTKMSKVNLKDFAKYLLRNGARDEKRSLLACLGGSIQLKGKKVKIISG